MSVIQSICSLPKIELHLHLEGSLRPSTVFELASRNDIDLGFDSVEALDALYEFKNFADFARLFRTGLSVLQTEQDFSDAVVMLAEELAGQNVRYAEVTSTPFQHRSREVPLEVYTAGLDDGRRRALDEHNVVISWICDISRESEPPESTQTVDFLLGAGAPENVVALGLGGFETGYPPELFRNSFDKARVGGLAAIPHAGEQVGAASVRGAVMALGARRIGHGVRCLEDPELVAELIERQIVLEVCPTSNVKLGVARSYAEHPLAELIEAGLAVTLNTDDPACFGVTLNDELRLAHEVHGLSVDNLAELQRTALHASHAGEDVKALIEAELNEWQAQRVASARRTKIGSSIDSH